MYHCNHVCHMITVVTYVGVTREIYLCDGLMGVNFHNEHAIIISSLLEFPFVHIHMFIRSRCQPGQELAMEKSAQQQWTCQMVHVSSSSYFLFLSLDRAYIYGINVCII